MKIKIVITLCIITLILVANGCGTKNQPDLGGKENITKPTETQGTNIDEGTKVALSTTPETTGQGAKLDGKAKIAISLIGKTTEEAISILGDKYEEEFAGDGLMSLLFKDKGMRLILESYDSAQTEIKVYTITFDENYNFNGCKSGMLFDEVKNKLGNVDAEETFIETPDHKAYTLTYTFDNAELEFLSYNKNGSDSHMILKLKQ